MTHSNDTPPPPSSPPSLEENDSGAEASAEDLKILRRLLLGGDLEDLLNPPLTPEVLAQMLPEAIAQASSQQERLTDAVLPTIESAIQASIQRDSNILSEVLFPVIGPATRKSISSAIGNLVQSLNQTLEYSLSPQSFKWRLEARRTGKSFAEVVLLRTLVYQVEQVFLIHRETGLVLQHVVAETATAQDPDLVSAMLTALEDFVKDSFAVETEGSLDTLEIGDFTLWVEEGPQAVLACVIRGIAPQSLREILQSAQEKIHLLFKPSLGAFDGDATALEGTRPYLEACFQAQFKQQLETNKKTRLPLSSAQKKLGWALVVCIGLAIAAWSFLAGQSHQRWQAYVTQVAQQPGIVVVSHGRERAGLWGDRYFLTGLRDPLAADPAELLATTLIKPDQIQMDWEPYFSLSSDLASKRITGVLMPPDTVSLGLDEAGILHLAGSASRVWIQSARQLSARLGDWGLAGWDDSALIATEQADVDRLITRIERCSLKFELGSANLRKNTTAHALALRALAEDIRALSEVARGSHQTVHIKILGSGDGRRGSSHNLWLGQARANTLRRSLLKYGVGAAFLESQPLQAAFPQRLSDPSAHRTSQVTFQVELSG